MTERQLRDGSRFQVVKRYWEPRALEAELAALGWDAPRAARRRGRSCTARRDALALTGYVSSIARSTNARAAGESTPGAVGESDRARERGAEPAHARTADLGFVRRAGAGGTPRPRR